jgi:predicted nucleic acid-binding protein
MILIDTSVWIDFFNGLETVATQLFENLIWSEEDVYISDYILTEVLQGFKVDREFDLAKKHLLKFPICGMKNTNSYIKAAQIYRLCCKKGITIRKTADCIIAQTAIENGLFLLHNDTDFDLISSICPLKIYSKKQLQNET